MYFVDLLYPDSFNTLNLTDNRSVLVTTKRRGIFGLFLEITVNKSPR